MASTTSPGGIFVTGHDPDYHAHSPVGNFTGSRHMIQRAVAYVTFNKPNPKLLLVTDLRNPAGDQIDSRLGMIDAGFTCDVAVAPTSPRSDATSPSTLDLTTVAFGNYDAVVVASDYGGWLRQDELNILNARSRELIDYVNNGGGLVAFDESGNRSSGPGVYTGTTANRFSFLPFLITVQSLNQDESGFTLTPEGTAMGLTTADINGNFSHSVFTATGGMDVIDKDPQGQFASLATRGKRVGPGGVDTCELACTRIIKFMTDHDLPASVGSSLPPYTGIEGYHHINIFVQFSQKAANELPVDLGVTFAFDANGTMSARRYVNLEANVPGPQSTNFIEVSGSGSWHGSPHNISSYVVRLPVMGPFVQVFVYNRAPIARKVNVWGYLVS
ncbi:MAG: hypothetical protein QOD00_998 [Blastocatellia bacterium]|nr:hypothetical protein [Blastocatellia bacterium]